MSLLCLSSDSWWTIYSNILCLGWPINTLQRIKWNLITTPTSYRQCPCFCKIVISPRAAATENTNNGQEAKRPRRRPATAVLISNTYLQFGLLSSSPSSIYSLKIPPRAVSLCRTPDGTEVYTGVVCLLVLGMLTTS